MVSETRGGWQRATPGGPEGYSFPRGTVLTAGYGFTSGVCPDYRQVLMASLQGQLLLASGALVDPNFARAIVLMVQHGDEGALGLILNRPLEITVGRACEQVLEQKTPCAVEGMLHQGGPCEGPLMVLHTHETQSDIEVVPGVYFSTDRAKIEWLLEHNDGEIKFFVGYAGWGEGQLEGEIETGSWVASPASERKVFDNAEGAEQWSRLMAGATLGRWIDPDHMPEDPSMN